MRGVWVLCRLVNNYSQISLYNNTTSGWGAVGVGRGLCEEEMIQINGRTVGVGDKAALYSPMPPLPSLDKSQKESLVLSIVFLPPIRSFVGPLRTRSVAAPSGVFRQINRRNMEMVHGP